MPTSYPSSNDSFKVPDSPTTVVLNSPGDATRNHGQFHQDTGDAIVALQQNVSLLSHDHSGTGLRATNPLNQSATHQNPDTDVAPASLHHTIGLTANQAAAGNHTHPTPTLYYSEARFNSTVTTGSGEATANTGWVAYDDVWNLWTQPGTGAPAYFTIPVAGRWDVAFTTFIGGPQNIFLQNKVYLNASGVSANLIGNDNRFSVGSAASTNLQIQRRYKFNANDKLYFSIYTASSMTLYPNYLGPLMTTQMSISFYSS